MQPHSHPFLAQLGAESIVEGGILSIAKSVGDYVAAEEMVAEIETGAPPAPLLQSFASRSLIRSAWRVQTR